MVSCCAYGCKNRTNSMKPGVTFHRFPSNSLRMQWIFAVKRKDFQPTVNTRLCSEHFEESDYTPTHTRKRLKPDAVPSVFKNYPDYFQKKKPRKKRSERSEKKDANSVVLPSASATDLEVGSVSTPPEPSLGNVLETTLSPPLEIRPSVSLKNTLVLNDFVSSPSATGVGEGSVDLPAAATQCSSFNNSEQTLSPPLQIRPSVSLENALVFNNTVQSPSATGVGEGSVDLTAAATECSSFKNFEQTLSSPRRIQLPIFLGNALVLKYQVSSATGAETDSVNLTATSSEPSSLNISKHSPREMQFPVSSENTSVLNDAVRLRPASPSYNIEYYKWQLKAMKVKMKKLRREIKTEREKSRRQEKRIAKLKARLKDSQKNQFKSNSTSSVVSQASKPLILHVGNKENAET